MNGPLILPFEALVSENERYTRSRTTHRLILTTEYRDRKAVMATLARKWWREPMITQECVMTARVWWPDRVRRDFGNYAKALKDALSGIVYRDDVLISDERFIRMGYDKLNPRAEVTITLLSSIEHAA